MLEVCDKCGASRWSVGGRCLDCGNLSASWDKPITTLLVTTETGSQYWVTQPIAGRQYWTAKNEDGDVFVCTAVGELREDLCKQALTGKRDLEIAYKGDVKVVGFAGSTATLLPTEPRRGWRLFLFRGTTALRLTTKVVEIVEA